MTRQVFVRQILHQLSYTPSVLIARQTCSGPMWPVNRSFSAISGRGIDADGAYLGSETTRLGKERQPY
ncbi:hypothetical protein [Arthrobacter sp. efr-133-R2A-120]|uniref:hypothetical protein n=1 Tax=Arthrobacter sp. efr-133-R2A-120 TaxID=3040277 RepID=UPI00254D1578|nr:hypothetical protein [Arthrobacter sp. efr-133-R2A-120]